MGDIETSRTKARAFLAVAESLGWELDEFNQNEEAGEFLLIVCREDEEIEILWINGAFLGHCFYRHGDREIKLRNASAAKQQMAKEPEEFLDLRKRNGELRAENANGEVASRRVRKSLPFDPETATEAEIFAAVRGKRLVWRNSITGLLESARVMKKEKQKQFKIESGAAGRAILTFCSEPPEGAFRSVALEALVKVTR